MLVARCLICDQCFIDSIKPIRAGDYEVRLLRDDGELTAYQRLRYAHLICAFNPDRNDADRIDRNGGYDEANAQLCVFYHNPETGTAELVGGYVLMRFRDADSFCKTTLEFDLTRFIEGRKHEILEISRVVVHPDHRNGTTLKLLWSGIEAYIEKYRLRWVIGTASFPGTDPDSYSHGLAYLQQFYLMDEDVAAVSLETHVLHLPAPESIDRDLVRRQLPPILRGYLMQGCKIGRGVYIDREFNSVDIFVVLDAQNRGRYSLK